MSKKDKKTGMTREQCIAAFKAEQTKKIALAEAEEVAKRRAVYGEKHQLKIVPVKPSKASERPDPLALIDSQADLSGWKPTVQTTVGDRKSKIKTPVVPTENQLRDQKAEVDELLAKEPV
jgi:hypothetical protein